MLKLMNKKENQKQEKCQRKYLLYYNIESGKFYNGIEYIGIEITIFFN